MGLWKDLGLAQPGASLADAAADWMRGPPLTDCWRLELCVPGRPKPPLCLAVSHSLSLPYSLPESTPPSRCFSLCLHFFLFLLLFSFYLLLSLLTAAPTDKSTYTLAKTCVLLTHSQKTLRVNMEYKNRQLQMFQSKWLKQISPYLLTVVLTPVIKSQ